MRRKQIETKPITCYQETTATVRDHVNDHCMLAVLGPQHASAFKVVFDPQIGPNKFSANFKGFRIQEHGLPVHACPQRSGMWRMSMYILLGIDSRIRRMPSSKPCTSDVGVRELQTTCP